MPVSLMAAAVALLLSGEPGSPSPRDEAKPICKRPSAQLGSLIRRGKTCHTAAEWRAIEEVQGTVVLQTKAPQPEPWQQTGPQ